MSNTRHELSEAPFRQERFASSREYDRGLLANLVAKRCELLDDAKEGELLWWLQAVSWRQGGLLALRDQIREHFEDNICTASMRKFGFKAGLNYTAEQAARARSEMVLQPGNPLFLTRGETIERDEMWDLLGEPDDWKARRRRKVEDEERLARALTQPAELPSLDFHDYCHKAAGELDQHLARICLDPETRLSDSDPWYFQGLRSVLTQIKDAEAAAVGGRIVATEIGNKVNDAFKFALKTRSLVIVNGNARIGKTCNARAWCAQRPGLARYAQVPATGDEIGFYRAIAKALGVSTNLNSKAQELRARIEEVLQTGQLLLCLDEAHGLWPQTNYRDALPQRVNWLMTALVNYGVPLVLVTTPQFFRQQRRIEERTCWTSEQFIGRVKRHVELPSEIPEADLLAVARHHLPEAGKIEMEAIVSYAQGSAKYLAAIDGIATSARYFAEESGRSEVRRTDIQRAMREGVIPSDRALAARVASGQTHVRRRKSAASLPLPGNDAANELQSSPELAADRPAAREETFSQGRRGITPAAVLVGS